MYQQPRMMPSGEPIPKNYSGNAFRYPPIGSLSAPPLSQAEQNVPLAEPEREGVDVEYNSAPLPVLPQARPAQERGRGGILRTLENEEWLLLGVCVLLLGEGSSSDLLPYLLLLLFLG